MSQPTLRESSVASTIAQASGGDPTCGSKFVKYIPLYNYLVSEFGEKPLWQITMVYGLIKGIAVQSVLAASLPILKDGFQISPAEYQRYSVVAVNAWALKPGIGLMSDNVPLAGYHKRTYLLFAVCCASLACLAMAMLPRVQWLAAVFAFFVFCANLSFATLDLLTEGTYSALMLQRPHTGASFVSWVWGMAMLGSIVAGGIVGPMADAHLTRVVLVMMVPVIACIGIPVAKNWVSEIAVKRLKSLIPRKAEVQVFLSKLCFAIKAARFRWNEKVQSIRSNSGDDMAAARVRTTGSGDFPSPNARNTSAVSMGNNVTSVGGGGGDLDEEAQRGKLERDRLCINFYGFSVANGAFILAMVSLFHFRPMYRFGTAIVVTGTLSLMSFLFLPPVAAKANLFMFLKEAMYVQIPGALDFFYTTTDCPKQDTPKFSYFYYQTFTSIVGNVAGCIGVMCFQKFLSKKNFRLSFALTASLKILASLFDVLIVTRWNKTKLGLGDHTTYLLGDAIVFNMTYMFDFLPASVLIAKMCPAGLESTMFALLAGFSNFGQGMSQTMGSALIEHYMPTPAAGADGKVPPNCDFSHLPQLVVVAHCVLPLLAIPLIFIMIPNANVSTFNEGRKIEEDEEEQEVSSPPAAGGATTTSIGRMSDLGEEDIASTDGQRLEYHGEHMNSPSPVAKNVEDGEKESSEKEKNSTIDLIDRKRSTSVTASPSPSPDHHPESKTLAASPVPIGGSTTLSGSHSPSPKVPRSKQD